MRKLLFSVTWLSLVAMLVTPMAFGQFFTVGDTSCSTTNAYIPVRPLYDYTESQYIIPAADLAAAGIMAGDSFIEFGWFQCSGTFNSTAVSLELYLHEVPAPHPQICTTPEPNGTLVYSGPLLTAAAPPECTSIVMDTAYTYGGGALVVTVCDVVGNWNGSPVWGHNVDTGNGIYAYRDSTPYDCDMTTDTHTCANPGPGEACNNPFVIDMSAWVPGGADTYTDSGDTTTAINNYDYSDYGCGSTMTTGEYVYSFTPPIEMDFEIDLCGSAYDTKLVITDNCPSSVTECYYNDDDSGGCSPQSAIHCQTYQAGVTYYIFVEGYGANVGAYTLNIVECGSAAPTPTPTETPTPAPGANCGNAIVVDQAAFPYADTNTNCGSTDDYNATCLGYYDGGEDIIYQINISSPTGIIVTLDPNGTTYAGFSIDDSCPGDPTTCIATYTNSSASTLMTSDCIDLAVGTYYIMIDTWSTPDCIPNFDLTIDACVAPPTPTPDPLTLCDPASIFSQPVIAETVLTTSDMGSTYISADDFSGLTNPITGIVWWGGELSNAGGWHACTRTNDLYEISFWDDVAGLPGTVQAQETVTATKLATTIDVFGNPAYGQIVRYEAFLATPVTMASGWISIQSTDDGASCWFMWADAGAATGSDYVSDDGTGNWAVSGYSLDLAFCLLAGSPPPTVTPTTVPTDTPVPPTATPTGPTPSPTALPPVPATGPIGLGLLMLVIGSLMSLTGIRRRK